MVEQRVRTRHFPTGPEGDLIGNNGMPGSHLAEFLRTAFAMDWRETKGILQEDYGWGFWLEDENSKYWIAVGLQKEDGPIEIPMWLILVYQAKGLNPLKWFKKRPSREQEIMNQIMIKLREIDDSRIEG